MLKTNQQINNWRALEKLHLKPKFHNKDKAIVKTNNNLYWELNNPFYCSLKNKPLKKNIKDFFPNRLNKAKEKQYDIPIVDLSLISNNMLSSCLYKNYICYDVIPLAVKNEILRRFKYELVGTRLIKRYLFDDDFDNFFAKHNISGRLIFGLHEFFDLFDKEDSYYFRYRLILIIQIAILFYSKSNFRFS